MNKRHEESEEYANQEYSKAVFITIFTIFAVVLAGVFYIISNHNTANNSNSNSNNPNGFSSNDVWTKASDFGNYTDWAQEQINQGIPVCEIQNDLAKQVNNVPVVPDCDNQNQTSSINTQCTSEQIGVEVQTSCRSN